MWFTETFQPIHARIQSMKFIDLSSENKQFKENIDKELAGVFETGQYLLGPQLASFEKLFAAYVGTKEAVGVKNCTDAIMILLKRLYKCGMPIIIPNFGAYPTSVACRNFTDNIHYVDVDESMTIDPNKLPDVKNGILISVHLFGNNCDFDSLKAYCKSHNHIWIEDCAQSTGSGCGTHGDYSVFSFYPTKPLGSMGDGGMICLDDSEEASYYRQYRFYGQAAGKIDFVGINSRLDEIQASVLIAKLPYLDEFNQRRNEIAARYKKLVSGYKVHTKSVYHLFTLLFNNRSAVIEELTRNDIPHMIHYGSHVTDHKALHGKNNNDVGFYVADKILSIPCHTFLLETDIQRIETVLESVSNYEYHP